VPVAPLAEQRRVVERIAASFAEIAEGEAALAEARRGLDLFRRSLLKAAVTGKLTREWRTTNTPEESGTHLLARILASRKAGRSTRRQGRRANQQTPQVASEFSNLPSGWTPTTLGALFDIYTGSTPSRSNPRLWNGVVPWVSSGGVAFCRIRSTRETISLEALGAASERLHPIGTVLLAMIGEGKTRGQCAILDIPATNNQNSAAIRVAATPIPPEFIYIVLQERYFASRRESQGGNQPALNAGIVADMPIALAPPAEIAEIVRRVCEALDAAYDAEKQLDAEAADAARLVCRFR
jgi:type I restriction enzyme, S subunit